MGQSLHGTAAISFPSSDIGLNPDDEYIGILMRLVVCLALKHTWLKFILKQRNVIQKLKKVTSLNLGPMSMLGIPSNFPFP